MKRVVILLAVFLLVLSSIAALWTSKDSTSFNIELTKRGTTRWYFASANSDTPISTVLFGLVDEETQTAEASLRFGWEIYDKGTYTVSLIFRSPGGLGADENGNDWMLRNTNSNSQTKGYNYSAYQISYDTNGNQSVGKDDLFPTDNSITEALPVENRTITLLNGKSISVSDLGHSDLQFSIKAPSYSNDGIVVTGFIEGQYEGEIVVNVTVV